MRDGVELFYGGHDGGARWNLESRTVSWEDPTAVRSG